MKVDGGEDHAFASEAAPFSGGVSGFPPPYSAVRLMVLGVHRNVICSQTWQARRGSWAVMEEDEEGRGENRADAAESASCTGGVGCFPRPPPCSPVPSLYWYCETREARRVGVRIPMI